MHELVLLYEQYKKYKRGRHEPAEIFATIEAEGGQVLEHRQISRLIKDPFHGFRRFPMLYEFRTQYETRSGHWYVRTGNAGGPYEWVWLDGDGCNTLPIAKTGAQVVNDMKAVGWLSDSILVCGLISIGVIVGIALFLWLF